MNYCYFFSKISTVGCAVGCSNPRTCRKVGRFYFCLCEQRKKGPNCEDTGTCTATLITSQLSQLPDYLSFDYLPIVHFFSLLVISMLLRQEVSIQLFYYCIHFLNCGFAYFFSPMWFNFILSLNFIFSLFVGMVLYDNEFQQRKWNLNQG